MAVSSLGRILTLSGLVLVVIGLALLWGGKLPGDFVFQRGRMTLHVPLATSLLVSLVLSAVLRWLR